MEFNPKDWKLFRSKIASWQEDYMARLNREYVDILSGEGNASDKFWKLEKRINRDKRSPGVIIRLRKQDLAMDLTALVLNEVITFADLDGFSDGIKDIVRHFCDRYGTQDNSVC